MKLKQCIFVACIFVACIFVPCLHYNSDKAACWQLPPRPNFYQSECTSHKNCVETSKNHYAEHINGTERILDAMEAIQEDTYQVYFTHSDAIDIAKVLYNECRGVSSKTEQACVAWTILNRVDYYQKSIHDVVREPNQFAFYESTPVCQELVDLAYDVLARWNVEKNGGKQVGRVLPVSYMYYAGDGVHNYFRSSYSGDYTVWNYSYESPYNS